MFNPLTVIVFFCLYIGVLFLIALWVERKSAQGKDIGNNPVIYSLSLAMYCTSWTFYGSVGSAATSGMLFLTIYLGPTMAVVLWWTVLRKIIRVKNSYRITSIADFISARYDKSHSIAAIVTVMALAGIVPYMALQLKSIITTFELLIGPAADGPSSWAAPHVGLLVLVLMTIFTIIFGVRRLDPTERHQGMVVALAAESTVKLLAFLAVGIFVTYGMYDGFGDIFNRLSAAPLSARAALGETGIPSYTTWMSYLVLAMFAIMFLPRQFHITVIENFDEKHLRTAMWLFPLYLFLINLFVFPIAKGGLLAGLPVQDADTFVLGLPLHAGQKWLSLLVFIGGFSAATGMIMISSMTMSIMITNHLLLPIIGQVKGLGFLRRHLLQCRWAAVAFYILVCYWFERSVGEQLMLINMGVISFAAALQFAPSLLGGIFWRQGNKAGALLGLTSGFLLWFYTLIVPTLASTGRISGDILEKGPWGLGYLRPEHLFGMSGLDPVSHAVFWTMVFNVGLYLLGSFLFEQTEEEQALAQEFVTALSPISLQTRLVSDEALIDLGDKKREIVKLLRQYFSEARSAEMVDQCLCELDIAGKHKITIALMTELLKTAEKHLAGSIGSAAAHRAIMTGTIISPKEEFELSRMYAEILANLKLTPSDLKEKIDYYQEKEALLTRQAAELEEKIKERDREIAERKRMGGALRESEEKYRTLVDNVNIGVYRNAGDPSGRFMQVNPAMVKMLGYADAEELMRTPTVALYQEPTDRRLLIEEARRNGFVKDKQLALRKKDGTPLWVSCSATVQYSEDGDIKWMDGVIEDITERMKLEEQLRHAQKMQAIGTLAGGVAHDFNNILTAIIGYGNLIKKSVKEGETLRSYVDHILTSSERAANLTKSLLAFSRKQIISPRPVSLNDIVKRTEKILLRVIGEDIELRTVLCDEELTIMADSDQLEQVLMNLATNARDSMPNGGALTIETSNIEMGKGYVITNDLMKPGNYALLSVSDTGAGMDEKTKQRIFEPFFTTKEVGKGTGLGLSIVYGIIKQHNGEINVYSEVGKGTIFRIYFPLITPTTEQHLVEIVAVPKGGNEVILIAEDDQEVRRLTRHVLSAAGYTIIEAVDGSDAIAKFLERQHDINLLILDVIMPKKNGKEVYEEIRKLRPGVKALFTSGYSAEIIHTKGILEEGTDFISKPMQPDELLKKVRESLDR
jgi:PAS domain S-box-containing protein